MNIQEASAELRKIHGLSFCGIVVEPDGDISLCFTTGLRFSLMGEREFIPDSPTAKILESIDL